MTVTIHHTHLVALGACAKQRAKFRRAWPAGLTLPTDDAAIAKLAERVARLGLDCDWAAERMLTAPALAAYEQATATAWTAYTQATAPAWTAYTQAKATALTRALLADDGAGLPRVDVA